MIGICLRLLCKIEFILDRKLLSQTLEYGSVTALQQSCQPIGKLLIQGVVNVIIGLFVTFFKEPIMKLQTIKMIVG